MVVTALFLIVIWVTFGTNAMIGFSAVYLLIMVLTTSGPTTRYEVTQWHDRNARN